MRNPGDTHCPICGNSYSERKGQDCPEVHDVVGRLAEGPLAKLFGAPEDVVGVAKVNAALRKVVAQRGERITADQRIIADLKVKLSEIDEIVHDYEQGHGTESAHDTVTAIRDALDMTVRWVGDDLTT